MSLCRISIVSMKHIQGNTSIKLFATEGKALLRGGDVAQLVGRRTGTSLRQVRFPGAAKDFSLPESTFRADSVTVPVQPLCAIACINICAHIKDPKHWQPYLCLDT